MLRKLSALTAGCLVSSGVELLDIFLEAQDVLHGRPENLSTLIVVILSLNAAKLVYTVRFATVL